MASRTSKVLALSLGQGFAMVVSLLTSIVLARRLTQEGLATYRQTFLAYSFVSAVLTLALPQALYFFLPRNPHRERTVLITNVLLLASLGGVFSLCLGFGGAHLLGMQFNNPQLESTMRALLVYPLIMFPAGAIGVCLVAKERTVTLAVYTVLSQIAVAGAIVGACVLRPDPQFLVAVSVTVAMCMAIPALALMFIACPAGPTRLDPIMAWGMLKFTAPLGLSGLLGTMMVLTAGIVVSALRPPSEFAVFSIGAVELPLIGIVTGSISTVILAEMARMCQARDSAAALSLFRTSALRSATVLLPSWIFFLVAARPFIEGLYTEKYEGSVLVFQLFLFLLPLRVVYYGPALVALGHTRQVLWRSVGDFALMVVLCLVFVRQFGYVGAVAALLATNILWSVPFSLFCVGKAFKIRMRHVLPLRQLASIALLTAVPGVLASAWRLVPQFPRLAQLALAFVIYAPLTFFLLWRGGFLPVDSLRGIPVVGPWLIRDRGAVRVGVPAREVQSAPK